MSCHYLYFYFVVLDYVSTLFCAWSALVSSTCRVISISVFSTLSVSLVMFLCLSGLPGFYLVSQSPFQVNMSSFLFLMFMLSSAHNLLFYPFVSPVSYVSMYV